MMSNQASGRVLFPKAEPKSWNQTLLDIWVIVSTLPLLPSAACLCLTFDRDFCRRTRARPLVHSTGISSPRLR